MYSGLTQQLTSTLKIPPLSYIILLRLRVLKSRLKLNKNPSLLAKQGTLSISNGCGLWFTLHVSPTEELRVYTTGVSGSNANYPGVSNWKGLNNSNKVKGKSYLLKVGGALYTRWGCSSLRKM